MNRDFYLDSDVLLLMATGLREKDAVLESLLKSLPEESRLFTSVLAQKDLAYYFGKKGNISSLRYYLSLIQPLFDEILTFTQEDMRRGLEVQEQLKLPGREAMVVGLMRNRNIPGLLSLSRRFGRIPGIIQYSLQELGAE